MSWARPGTSFTSHRPLSHADLWALPYEERSHAAWLSFDAMPASTKLIWRLVACQYPSLLALLAIWVLQACLQSLPVFFLFQLLRTLEIEVVEPMAVKYMHLAGIFMTMLAGHIFYGVSKTWGRRV